MTVGGGTRLAFFGAYSTAGVTPETARAMPSWFAVEQ